MSKCIDMKDIRKRYQKIKLFKECGFLDEILFKSRGNDKILIRGIRSIKGKA